MILKTGPLTAEVEDIQVIDEDYQGEFKKFNVKY